ncbi:MAG: hypothetical protein M1817_002469 [Caeruleum heppii]|nr:MAG: hypothetical protein M1817_002469 [Caeruleum heppii]
MQSDSASVALHYRSTNSATSNSPESFIALRNDERSPTPKAENDEDHEASIEEGETNKEENNPTSPERRSISQRNGHTDRVTSADLEGKDSAQGHSLPGQQSGFAPDHKRKRTPPDGMIDSVASGSGESEQGVIEVHASITGSNTPQDAHAIKRARTRAGGQGTQESDGLRSSGQQPELSKTMSPEAWRHVFNHLQPRSLAQLSRVNRWFRDRLEPAVPEIRSGTGHELQGTTATTKSEAIWAASRKVFHRDMPKPLRGHSELEMWKLMLGTGCQYCDKRKDPVRNMLHDYSSQSAPADDDVMVVWPFGVRSCFACLLDRCEKDVSLLISSSVPSALLAALPFVLISAQHHVITPWRLQTTSHSTPAQMTKYFFKPHVDEIKQQLEGAKALGSGVAEEWFKGLEGQGKERIDDSGRWERWESNGGVQNLKVGRATRPQSPPSRQTEPYPVPVVASAAHYPSHASVSNADGRPPTYLQNHSGVQATHPQPVHQPMSVTQYGPPAVHNNAFQPQRIFKQPRVERSMTEVNERRAMRRAEIERRCSELQPPISADLLNHMESFQNAMQIITPLTDSAWEVLKPRLLAQREAAEQREQERLAQIQMYQAKAEERRQQEAQIKEAREMQDKEWDEAQTPIRERLARYAEEVINDRWSSGTAVTKDNSPRFAADVLVQVRRRFYVDLAQGDAAASSGQNQVTHDADHGPPFRKLLLENMKWTFDTKIKPITEQYRKELFLCHDCENPSKFYGFEGVVQHFAAKHTNALSQGNIVVHWRAEWPEYSPFHPDPSTAKPALYAGPPPGRSTTGPPPARQSTHGNFQHGSYPQHPSVGPSPVPQGFVARPGPFGPLHQYPEQDSRHAYEPGSTSYRYHDKHSGYPGTEVGVQASNYNSYQGPVNGYPPAMYQDPQYEPSYAYASNQYPGPQIAEAQHPAHGPYTHGPVPPSYQPIDPERDFPRASQGSLPPQRSNQVPHSHSSSANSLYQTQLEEMSNAARDMWTRTSGIKDLPGSVRTYVIIQQTDAIFRTRFGVESGMEMFMDGLANHPKMKPLNNLNGIICRACGLSVDYPGSHGPSHPPRYPSGDRKMYTLPALLAHFRVSHVDGNRRWKGVDTGPTMPRPDWRVDMVEIPDEPSIGALINAPGIDDDKLGLLAHVFPSAFPTPLPRVGRVPLVGQGPVPSDVPATIGPSTMKSNTFQAISHSGFPKPPQPIASNPNDRRDVVQTTPRDSHRLHAQRDLGQQSPRFQSRPQPSADTQLAPVVQRRSPTKSYAPDERSIGRQDPPPHHQSLRGDPGRPPNEHDTLPARSHNGQTAPLSMSRVSRTEPQQGALMPSTSTTHDAHQIKREASLEGSEDGEVRAEAETQHPQRSRSPAEEISAAERFLNDFMPGDNIESYQTKAAKHERRQKPRHPPEHGSSVQERVARPDGLGDSRRRAHDPLLREGASVRDGNKRVSSSASRHGIPDSPPMGGPQRQYAHHGVGHRSRSPARYMRQTEAAAEYEPHYLDQPATRPGGRYLMEGERRPRSRYDRYEDYRQEPVRGRSRSPLYSAVPLAAEERYPAVGPRNGVSGYESFHRGRSPVPMMAESFPADDRLYDPSAGIPQGRYVTYRDEFATAARPLNYPPSHREHVEYMPYEAAPGPEAAYVVDAPSRYASGPVYSRYEEGAPGPDYYDEHGRVYRVRNTEYSVPRGRTVPGQEVRYG